MLNSIALNSLRYVLRGAWCSLRSSSQSGSKEKSRWKAGLIYGWVSKYRETKFPYTILKIISSNKKLFVKNFIHIFLFRVNKQLAFRFKISSAGSILRDSAILSYILLA
jgi:hypothetical protein